MSEKGGSCYLQARGGVGNYEFGKKKGKKEDGLTISKGQEKSRSRKSFNGNGDDKGGKSSAYTRLSGGEERT